MDGGKAASGVGGSRQNIGNKNLVQFRTTESLAWPSGNNSYSLVAAQTELITGDRQEYTSVSTNVEQQASQHWYRKLSPEPVMALMTYFL